MTAAILAAKQGLIDLHRLAREIISTRIAIPLGLALLAWYSPAAGWIIVETAAEAYLQVTVFVATTLALIYGAERLFQFDLATWLAQRRRAQVPVAAFLGALPGCGGAIVVVTQYVSGHVGFGSLIAVLTATMGDAAFLLLSQEPLTALVVLSLGMIVGTLCGYIVELLHGPGFMRMQATAGPEEAAERAQADRRPWRIAGLNPIWLALLAPGIVFAVPVAMQIDPNSLFGPLAGYHPVTWLGFTGAMLALLMWTAHLTADPRQHAYSGHSPASNPNDCAAARPSLGSRVINDTNFVTVWVLAAFLLFELGVHFSGTDVGGWLTGWALLMPLIAVLVGFLPGCGPQIIITTLYLTGAVPMAALLANAISNDGDALFPAIALAPRAAIIATLYTGIPALVLGYGAYFYGF